MRLAAVAGTHAGQTVPAQQQTGDNTVNNAEQFFYTHAGYSYDPAVETVEQGRQRGAVSLATAEAWASINDIGFEWGPDDCTNREHTDEGLEYRLWTCVATERTDTGMCCVDSLSGIDMGPDSHPCNDPCARVVEAELALEAMRQRTHA